MYSFFTAFFVYFAILKMKTFYLMEFHLSTFAFVTVLLRSHPKKWLSRPLSCSVFRVFSSDSSHVRFKAFDLIFCTCYEIRIWFLPSVWECQIFPASFIEEFLLFQCGSLSKSIDINTYNFSGLSIQSHCYMCFLLCQHHGVLICIASQ